MTEKNENSGYGMLGIPKSLIEQLAEGPDPLPVGCPFCGVAGQSISLVGVEVGPLTPSAKHRDYYRSDGVAAVLMSFKCVKCHPFRLAIYNKGGDTYVGWDEGLVDEAEDARRES